MYLYNQSNNNRVRKAGICQGKGGVIHVLYCMSIGILCVFSIYLNSIIIIIVSALFCFLSEAVLGFVIAKSVHLCKTILTSLLVN